MKKKYLWVRIGDDCAEGIFEEKTGKLICTLDIYHGENGEITERFCDKIGIPFEEVYVEDLLGRSLSEEEKNTDFTDEIPSLKLIRKAIISRGLTRN